MKQCTVVRDLEIVEGDGGDYERLGGVHYRGGRMGPWCRIYAIRPGIGVIVYKMPVPGLELRNIALGDALGGLTAGERLSVINKSIRCISRVIIDPRYRGLGLAARLVRETMPLLGVPIIEALAVMGQVNPFFKKAGMSEYRGVELRRCCQLKEAFSLVRIEGNQLIDPRGVQEKIDSLDGPSKDFIEGQIRRFLQAYGKRRAMSEGIERTRFVLNRLGDRPSYYIKILEGEIQRIDIERLKEHPDNPNRMSGENFRKLKRHIEGTGRYEPVVVRKLDDRNYQIINGHHRVRALAEVGYNEAECLVWDLDDEQADMLLLTLNRLGGSDVVEKKIAILKRLSSRSSFEELAKLLPGNGKKIKALARFKLPEKLSGAMAGSEMASPVVFFLNGKQKQRVERALEAVNCRAKTRQVPEPRVFTGSLSVFLGNFEKRMSKEGEK